VHPLEAAARERIVSRLKRAWRLAIRDLAANADDLREVLAETLAQADAFVAAHGWPSNRRAKVRARRAVDGHSEQRSDEESGGDAHGPSQPRQDSWPVSQARNDGSCTPAEREVASRGDASQPLGLASVHRTTLAARRGEPVREFLLIPFGTVEVDRPTAGRSFEFTLRHAESAKRWFDALGRKLAIDYEHQSFGGLNTRPDGLSPAAGWIGGLEVRDDGLWAVDVTWTERAAELLRGGEYRYFSPVIFWTDEEFRDLAGLGPVALTNDPAMRGVAALAASRQGRDVTGGQAVDDEVTQVKTVGTEAVAQTEAEQVLRGELEAAREEVEVLRRQLAAQEADAFVERGLRLGKILDSTSMDWREDYLCDPERAEARLSRAPVLLPPGRVVKVDAFGGPRSPAEAGCARRASGGGARRADVYATLGVEAEDLAAYERALAARRVRYFG